MSDEHVTIDLDGFLQDLGDLSDLDIDQALLAGGLVVEGQAKMNIIDYDFIDTGATLNSTAAAKAAEGVVQVGPETEYAIFGELGLGGQSEKPFMRRALNEHLDDVMAAIAYDLERQIQRKAK